jgi:hypothetical protein
MFNPDIQYRCDIIRGKAQKELDNLLPSYANIIADISPETKENFKNSFRDKLSTILFKNKFSELNDANQKTVDNHRTEIAGKLFGLYYNDDTFIYESESNKKLLEDNDQPAFFKNLCLNFQFPNGTQAIQTIIERISELNTQENYGARPIKRIIQNMCEDFLSEEILKGNIKENVGANLKFKDGEIKIFKKNK